ncbi:MAG: response regulator [Croceibacterium sp.]
MPFETPILIVEDEVLIAWTLHDMVVEMGFADVRLARNGAEAVALAADRHPGLLICDVNLGAGDDGVATAARIRATEWAPVLFITGYAGDDIRARIDSAVFGAALLRKPIEPRPLAAQLRAALLAQKPN